MTSCEEATYYLEHCPHTEVDRELEFLKGHPVFIQGLKGERLVAERTGS